MPYDRDAYVREAEGFNCNYDEFTAGPKPRTADEFLQCLDRVFKGIDLYAADRRRVRDTVHLYQDGFSSERVYKVFLELVNEAKTKSG